MVTQKLLRQILNTILAVMNNYCLRMCMNYKNRVITFICNKTIFLRTNHTSMKFYEHPENILILDKQNKNSITFEVYAKRMVFDEEFKQSCIDYIKFAFDIDVEDYCGKNKYMNVIIAFSQVKRSQSFDLVFTLDVYKIKDAERFKNVMYLCMDMMNEHHKLPPHVLNLLDYAYGSDMTPEEAFEFLQNHFNFIEQIMELDMHIDEPNFIPKPNEIMEVEDGVMYVPDMTINNAKYVDINGQLYVEYIIGHDVVLQKVM